MIETVIVDDEPLARDRIRQLLTAAPDFHVAAECADGVAAVEAIANTQPDLVFLDVQMPEMSGLEIVEAIGVEQMPITIFVTAFDRYAIDAFERHALDYLLKPVDDTRFAGALDRVRRMLEREEHLPSRRLGAWMGERPSAPLERMLVRRGETLVFIRTMDIDWVESIGNYVAIHVGAEKFLHRGTLGAFEQRLDWRRFIRVHRGALVQIDRVREIQTLFGRSRVVLRSGKEIPLSRRCRRKLEEFDPASKG